MASALKQLVFSLLNQGITDRTEFNHQIVRHGFNAKSAGRILWEQKIKLTFTPIKRSYLVTDEELLEINRLYDQGVTISELAKKYLINPTTLENKLFSYRQQFKPKTITYQDILEKQGLTLEDSFFGPVVRPKPKDQLAFLKSKIHARSQSLCGL